MTRTMTRHILIFVSLLWAGCSAPDRAEPSGSGAEPSTPLTTRNVQLVALSSWDRTGVTEHSDSLPAFGLDNNRLSFRWWEEGRSDYFAYLTDPSTGDTLKVLFEGATKKGLAEVSFNVSALTPDMPTRWLLTRKGERDTLQQLDFYVN